MNFTELGIEGFGVWSGLRLTDFSRSLNVFYGPNEAGKTTILEFTRSMLFGFTPSRRSRYLPPLRGSRAAGELGLTVAGRPHRLRRVDHPDTPLGETSLVDPHGITHGDGRLAELLGEIDERTFENVFALGLDELHELRSLDGLAAARMLYDLSTGLDRVSLAAVCRELETSRSRLLAHDEQPSRIPQLTAERDKLTAELEQLGLLTRRHWQLSGDRRRLAQSIALAEVEHTEIQRETKLVDLALAIEHRWHARAELIEQLSGHAASPNFPPDAIARLEQIKSHRAETEKRIKIIRRRGRKLRTEIDAVRLNEPLLKQAAKIHALAETENWITSAEQQVRDAQAKVDQLAVYVKSHAAPAHAAAATSPPNAAKAAEIKPDAKASAAQKPADAKTDKPAAAASLPALPAHIDYRALVALKAPAKELRRATLAAKAQRQAIVETQAHAKGQLGDLEQALADAGETDLKAAVEKTGQQVAQLRRRVQLEERLDRMTRSHADLEQQAHELLERQILPLWILAALGCVFVLGVLLLLAGVFLPSQTGNYGGPLAVFGLVLFGGAAGTKWFLEHAVAQNLESVRKQTTLLDAQLQQAQKERDAIDAELPAGGGPMTARLQTAEASLAKLEQLLPLEAQRDAAGKTVQSADQRAIDARDALKAAHRRWQAALVGAGLSNKLTPAQLRGLIRQHSAHAKAQQQLHEATQELQRKTRDLASLTGRIEPLYAEASLKPHSHVASEQIRHLRRLLGEQESLAEKSSELFRKQRRLRRQRKKQAIALRRHDRHRLSLFRAAGVADEIELMRVAQQRAHLEQLHERRHQLDRDIAAACHGTTTETDLAALLAPGHREHLRERHTQLKDRAEHASRTLQNLFEQRGQLNEQFSGLSDHGRIGRLRLQLGVVEQQLADAIHRWQTLAVTGSLLHSIRLHYERDRQPETLRQASHYLARMTAGRYKRVWTPMEEDVLWLDDSHGATLPVEALSRGTREQLLLSLRLALARAYDKRGVTMPLVLDDVLVNFDQERATLAAETLRDFAEAGHQVLLFTCHEHLTALFKRLGARVQRLPNNRDLSAGPEPAEAPLEMLPIEPLAPPAVHLNGEHNGEHPPRRRKPKTPKPAPVEPVAIEHVAIEPPAEPAFVELPPARPTIVASAIGAPLAVRFPDPLEPVLADLVPIEPRRPPARRHRTDLPHRRSTLAHVRHRWSAEEFDGELEDRVAMPTSDDNAAGYEI